MSDILVNMMEVFLTSVFTRTVLQFWINSAETSRTKNTSRIGLQTGYMDEFATIAPKKDAAKKMCSVVKMCWL